MAYPHPMAYSQPAAPVAYHPPARAVPELNAEACNIVWNKLQNSIHSINASSLCKALLYDEYPDLTVQATILVSRSFQIPDQAVARAVISQVCGRMLPHYSVPAASPAYAYQPSVALTPEQMKEKQEQQAQAAEESEQIAGTDFGEAENSITYSSYAPPQLHIDGAKPHPASIVETACMNAAQPPAITVKLSLPRDTILRGKVSNLQLEAVAYACQQHEIVREDGYRLGFFIGDGAGVGKGRECAAIIFNAWLQGHTKALWFSTSSDLWLDAKRDLDDIGGEHIPIYPLHKQPYDSLQSKRGPNIQEGVIFSTYTSLIAGRNNGRKSRLKQLLRWCGKDFDGCMIFDECHRAKSLNVNGPASKTALAVIEIQKKCPKARVVYCSATGASQPEHIGYMDRLGIWGAGTPFPAGFASFLSYVSRRGLAALEVLAMDMRKMGMYVARMLSFEGTSFEIVNCPLNAQLEECYARSSAFWIKLRRAFISALKSAAVFEAEEFLGVSALPEDVDDALGDFIATSSEEEMSSKRSKKKKTAKGRKKGNPSAKLWMQFWASQQRFFKYLCIASKVPTVASLAKESLKQGKCVVIGLQSTGEAHTERAVYDCIQEMIEAQHAAATAATDIEAEHSIASREITAKRAADTEAHSRIHHSIASREIANKKASDTKLSETDHSIASREIANKKAADTKHRVGHSETSGESTVERPAGKSVPETVALTLNASSSENEFELDDTVHDCNTMGAVQDAKDDQIYLDRFVSAPRAVLKALVEKHFPLPPQSRRQQQQENKARRIERLKEHARIEAMAPRKRRSTRQTHNVAYKDLSTDEEEFETSSEEPSFESESESEDELWNVKAGTWVETKFFDNGALDNDSDDEFDNLCCEICGSGADDENILLCDFAGGCNRGFHMYCLNPPLLEVITADANLMYDNVATLFPPAPTAKQVPEGDWLCPFHDPRTAAGAVKAQAARADKQSSWYCCQVLEISSDRSEFTVEHEGKVQKRLEAHLVRKLLFDYFDDYTEAQAAKKLAVGMQVETQRGRGVHWYKGKISAVDSGFTIEYADGLVGVVEHGRIRKLRNGVQTTVTKRRSKRRSNSASRKRKRHVTTKSKKKGRRRLEKASNAATELARKARDDWTSRQQRHVARDQRASDDDYSLSERSDNGQEDSDNEELASAKSKVFMAKFMMSSRTPIGLRISDGKTCVPALQQMAPDGRKLHFFVDSVVPGGQAQLLGLRASMWLYSLDDVILDSPYLDLGQIVDQMKRVKGPLIRLGVVCSSALKIKASRFKQSAQKSFEKALETARNLAMVTRAKLLAELEAIPFPNNPLDDLVDSLGGAHSVAEMTGRRHRLLKVPRTDAEQKQRYVYQSRTHQEDGEVVAIDLVNIEEKRKFNNGDKLVAIISDASSAGISLHADRRVKNHRRRVHITLELPWSAEKTIQQLGRTHRANHVSAPEYKLAISAIGGEKRFASSAAARLEALGAITRGDRRASTGAAQMSSFNFNNRLGRTALKMFYDNICNYADGYLTPTEVMRNVKSKARETRYPLGMIDAAHTEKGAQILCDWFTLRINNLRDIGIVEDDRRTVAPQKMTNIDQFFNRLLMLPLEHQNETIDYFLQLHHELQHTRPDFSSDTGTLEISGNSVTLKSSTKVFDGKINGADTFHYVLSVDRGVTYASMREEIKSHRAKSAAKCAAIGKDADAAKSCINFGQNDCVLVSSQGKNANRAGKKANRAGKITKVHRAKSGKQTYTIQFADGKTSERVSPENMQWDENAMSGFYVSNRKMFGHFRYLAALRREKDDLSAQTSFDIYWPSSGLSRTTKTREKLLRLYHRCKDSSKSVVKKGWTEQLERSESPKARIKRCRDIHIIGGTTLPVWETVESAVQSRSSRDTVLRIVRATTDDEKQFVGLRIPNHAVPTVLASLERLQTRNGSSALSD